MPGSSTTNWPVDRAAHEARKYWSERLRSVRFEQHIALDHPRPPDGRPEYRVHEQRLQDVTQRDLQRLTGGKPFLAFTALLLATKLACRQYSGNPDVTVLCPPVADGGAQTQLPIHSVLDPDDTFKQALRATRELLADAFRHDRLPFARLMIDLPADRRPDAVPLVASMAELTSDAFDVDADIAIRFSAGDAAAATIRYDARLFAEATIVQFARLVDHILAAGVRDPNARLADLAPDHPALEPPAASAHIHERVAGRAAEHPERVAIVEGSRVTTYGELERHASELAHRLSAAGLKPRTTVAVLLQSSTDMVVAIDAVWKAGGIVAPLRPLATARPIEQALQVLGCASVICRAEDVPRIRDVSGAATGVGYAFVAEYSAATSEYELERFAVGGAAESDAQLLSDHCADLACVFAAGDSRAGVTHAELASAFDHVNEQAGIGAQDRCLFSPSLGASEQLYDTFGMLLAGASVELWNDPGRREPAALLQRLMSEHITVWDLPAGLVLNLLPQLAGAPRVILLTGQKQSAALAGRLRAQLAGTCVIGLYAPPAVGVWTTVFDLTAQAVGRPVPGFSHRILTTGATIAPVLGRGELHLGVATGTIRTGMRAQRLEDSGLRWLRGEDHRCRRGGCGVELTTLEEALCEQDGIRAAEVRDLNGQVVAFVLGDVGDEAALRARMAMDRRIDLVPDRFEALTELPLQADGSIDEDALTKDLAAAGGGAGADGRPELENAVRRLWRESLEVEAIDEDESYFAAGGNSLTATMLIDRIRKELGVHVSVQRFFREPTARAVAQLVVAESGNGAVAEPGADFGPVSREQYRRVLQRAEPGAGGP
jgi:non-ribosomal peptide synthetase component F/acyl carrier protein